MTGFLAEMAVESAARAAAAASRTSKEALEERIWRMAPPRPLPIDGSTFLLIAELKRRSPAGGLLATGGRSDLVSRAREYVAGGAAAISVLTEPKHFDGSLADLDEVSTAVEAPVLRKDFVVDSYQVVEARARGASGVLLIVRLLSDASLLAMIEVAQALGLFALLETFDAVDVRRAAAFITNRGGPAVLLGVNCRDLTTLQVVKDRFAELLPLLPAGVPRIAESGLLTAADVVRIAELGYDGALVGGAFMKAADPRERVAEWIAAATRARR